MEKTNVLILLFFISVIISSCKEKSTSFIYDKAIIENAEAQYALLSHSVDSAFKSNNFIPRTIKDTGGVSYVSIYDWTSGFYAGSLWYLNFLTENPKWEQLALKYTKRLDSIQYWIGNHDVGFMIECSYGNALKKLPSKAFDSVIVQSAKSLSTRFRPNAGIIQSWNASQKWNCPVIIDNMMNLELLFHATKISGDSTYYNLAVSHADKTLENHFRVDNSSYHVLNYDTSNGNVLIKNKHQGLADDSAWSRGQSWGLYGFTVCYRETNDKRYLEQALKIAEFIKTHPNLPKDNIPYWDYNAPNQSDTPRDASAAAIAASALYELSGFLKSKGNEYKTFADEIMFNLCSPSYFSDNGTNAGFLLKHSVGSLPHGVEVDVPLNYADYYFLEALYRLKQLNK
ncbi:glycoside hydrolase family 88 protein [Aestuariivivens marinum]|uniref:glycoside hydrolase family 88 protein n=1 Tax=Aestuariivivens marinum TaxID=2913555 RepID=UPI001F586F29|nr:glycoside hydrolase family 88 protein [Aestuariivivens marinum]